MKPISASSVAAHRSPWLTRQRLRQAAIAAGALLGLYAVLVLIALMGGPRIGASFLPLPGGGPDPATPVAGLEPSRVPTSGPTVPRGSETPVPTVPPTPGQTTTLPPATTTGPVASTGTGQPTDGAPTTPCPTTKPAPQVVDHQDPSIPPATKVPPKPTTSTPPDPTTQPTKPPVTNDPPPPTNDPPPTTPSNPPPPPDEPEEPDHPGLVGGLLDTILDTIGL